MGLSVQQTDYNQYIELKSKANDASVQAVIMLLLDKIWDTPGIAPAINEIADTFPRVYSLWVKVKRNE